MKIDEIAVQNSEIVIKIKIKNDTVLASKRNRWKNSLKKDIYLNEAINILEDLKLNFIGENKLISFN